MKKHAVIALLALPLLLLAACGGGDDEAIVAPGSTSVLDTANDTSAGAVASNTADATHPGSPGGTALVPEVNAGTTVLVVLEDGSIGVREQTIPPGPAVLTVMNSGSDVHNLFIEGEGLNLAAGDSIPAGQRREVNATFRPGSYVMYCPVLDHRQKGEQITVTIKP